jgi:hypothetical protein
MQAFGFAHDLYRKPVPSPIGAEDMLFGIVRMSGNAPLM